jgi:hypothetical protein
MYTIQSRDDLRKIDIPLGPAIKIWNALLKVGAVSEAKILKSPLYI